MASLHVLLLLTRGRDRLIRCTGTRRRTPSAPVLTRHSAPFDIHRLQNEVGSAARSLWTTLCDPGAMYYRAHLHAEEVCSDDRFDAQDPRRQGL